MLDLTYNPFDWYWIVGGDDTRYWSSAVGTWVQEYPEGAGLTRIASEMELSDVLADYGLPGPVDRAPDRVSPAQAEIALWRYEENGYAPGQLLAQVRALIETYPYEPVRIWWRKATYLSRDHPYLQALAIELGLSEETVDGLFLAADAI